MSKYLLTICLSLKQSSRTGLYVVWGVRDVLELFLLALNFSFKQSDGIICGESKNKSLVERGLIISAMYVLESMCTLEVDKSLDSIPYCVTLFTVCVCFL